MEIKSTLEWKGKTFDIIYRDIDTAKDLGDQKISGAHAFCFYKDKLVIVYAANKNRWTPPGGGVEEGETVEQAVVREIKEETNMKVLHHQFIGYQIIIEPGKTSTQTRSFCMVEPYGEFVSDPDEGEITEIKLIDPKDIKQYFDWENIGDHILERAIQMKNGMK
jgi:8-oxo-dGTP diphosphatase